MVHLFEPSRVAPCMLWLFEFRFSVIEILIIRAEKGVTLRTNSCWLLLIGLLIGVNGQIIEHSTSGQQGIDIIGIRC